MQFGYLSFRVRWKFVRCLQFNKNCYDMRQPRLASNLSLVSHSSLGPNFSRYEISSHETFSLHHDTNHNTKPNTNPDPHSAVAVTCLKIIGRKMNCGEMNCPVPASHS